MRSARTGKYRLVDHHCAGGDSRIADPRPAPPETATRPLAAGAAKVCRGLLERVQAPAWRAPIEALELILSCARPRPEVRRPGAMAVAATTRVVERLMRRDTFVPAPGHNLLASAWPLFHARFAGPPATASLAAAHWWVGTGLLQTLFAREHNAIYRYLARANPAGDDAGLQAQSRAATTALIRNIHLREWCPVLSARPAWRLALRALHRTGATLARGRCDEQLSMLLPGIGPLLPDRFEVNSAITGSPLAPAGGYGLAALHGRHIRDFIERFDEVNLWYSFGIAPSGAFTLRNHPLALQRLPGQDGEMHDLLAAELDRHRKSRVASYNDVRECLGLSRARSLSDFVPGCREHLREVYRDVDEIDALAGLLAEARPAPCALGETALRCVLAGTLHGNEVSGLGAAARDWVSDNCLRTVLLRHYPVLQDALYRVDNPFTTWRPINLIGCL